MLPSGEVDLVGVDLMGVDLVGVDLVGVDLVGVDLVGGHPTVKRGTDCGMDSFRELTGSESML